MLQRFSGPPCAPVTETLTTDCTVPSFVSASEIVSDACVSSGEVVLDGVLGGGFRVGNICEIFGEAGCGKTQLLLHIAIMAACRNETVLFCVSEPLPQARLSQLASMYATSCGGVASAEDILGKIMITRVPSEEHMVRLLAVNGPAACQCEASLHANSRVTMLLLDSITAACAGGGGPRAAERVGYHLKAFAVRFSIAVVVSNQVRARPGDSKPMATMGLGWANTLHTRIGLSRPFARSTGTGVVVDEEAAGGRCLRRVCESVFSPTQAPFRLEYSIDNAGVHFYSYCEGMIA